MSEKKKIASKGVSRRAILKGTAAVAGVGAAAAVGGFPTVWANELKDITLRTLGLAVSNMDPFAKMASDALGFTVQQTAIDLGSIANRGITQPKSFDILEPAYLQMKFVWPTGNFQPVDANRLGDWNKVSNLYKTGKIWDDSWYGDGQNPSTVQYVDSPDATGFAAAGSTDMLTCMPILHNADTLGLRPDVITRPIDSWGELLNDEFNGKTALVGFPAIGLMDAAMALEALGMATYGDKGQMTRPEIDKTIDLLIEYKKKGHFRALWTTFNESVNLMLSGEVVLQSMWSPAVTAVRAKGVPCVYQDLKEGYRSWTLGLMLPKHNQGKKLDATYDYLNWYLSGPAGTFLGRQGYYVVTPENTKADMPAAEWDFWYEGKAATTEIRDPFGGLMEKVGAVRDGGSYRNRMGRVAVWNSVMDENEYLTDKWNEFVAA